MDPHKPIETRYKGYRFRSRLEARWAVFLDFLKIRWEYEAEGFELPSGPYLPDFWLPDLECWLEVKPQIHTGPELNYPERVKAAWKCWELCRHTGDEVYLWEGLPSSHPFSDDESYIGLARLFEPSYPPMEKLNRADIDSFESDICLLAACDRCDWAGFSLCSIHMEGIGTHRLEKAFKAAKSARFEFGEGSI